MLSRFSSMQWLKNEKKEFVYNLTYVVYLHRYGSYMFMDYPNIKKYVSNNF